ncbi:MAG: fused MFS/spermidine synthase [Planctomycetota bacterium]
MALFAISLFISSTLLFLIQPMEAKRLLPLLGGTPAVWNTCMLFFQALLLAGYAYSHFLTEKGTPRRQVMIHAVVLLLPFLSLAMGLPDWTPPVDANPVPWLLAILAVSVGLPFFAVSTTAPLLQRWFSGTAHAAAKDPYFLFAASNLGSMVALLAYPVLVEPWLRLNQQRWSWIAGYAIFVALMFACMTKIRPAKEEALPEEASPGWPRRLRWIALAFVPSSLMLGMTTYATTNITPFPLLWVIPLAAYLLSFIVVFARKPVLRHTWMLAIQPVALIPLAALFHWKQGEFNYAVMFPLHLVAFFLTAMVCHGEMAALRPGPRRLTEFYLCMSLGGVLGGAFNSIIAPLAFKTLAEYPLILVASCLLRPGVPVKRPEIAALIDLGWLMGLWFVALAILAAFLPSNPLLVLVPAGVVCFFMTRRPIRYAMGIISLLAVGAMAPGLEAMFRGLRHPEDAGSWQASSSGAAADESKVGVLRWERNFFGALRVEAKPDGSHSEIHGSVLHGVQDMRNPREPLTYFHRGSAIGLVFAAYDAKLAGADISVVGLGIGTMAAYGKAGQTWTFWEINPIVNEIARDPACFTYLRDCLAHVDVVLGDGRLTLQNAPDGRFTLMAFDAFTSESIPIHLVTREAIQTYLKKLAPGGLMAFHISARFIDLRPVLRELARDAGLACRVRNEAELPPAEQQAHKINSTWFLMARSEQDFEPLKGIPDFRTPDSLPAASVWTDDFSNILQVLRLGGLRRP